MKQYPTIPASIRRDQAYYAFDKLDGSNIRAEWSKKRGFHKFGTRTQLLDSSYLHPFLGEAPALIMEKYEKDVTSIMKKNRLDRGIFFFEFYGPNSFAGYHYEEPHTVTLFDVSIYKTGFLPPKEYLQLFGSLDIAKLLHYGKVNSELEASIRDGSLDGMTFEGVVCKAAHPKKPGPIMFKVKNQAWYDKLQIRCGDDQKLFEELA